MTIWPKFEGGFFSESIKERIMIRLLFYRENLIQVDSIEFENFEFTKKVLTKKAFKTRPQGRQRVKMQRQHNKAIYFLKNHSYFMFMWIHEIFL